MRVSAPITSLLVAALCLAASAPAAVFAQDDVADSGNSTLVFNPADVVEEIVMGDEVSDAIPPSFIIADGGNGANGDVNSGPALTPELRFPFIETIAVHRPFDDLIVTTPDVGQISIVRVKDGKKSKSKRKPFKPPRTEYLYGEFMILRLRSITNELVTSIRADPDQPTEQGLVLTHTVTNTKVSSKSTTVGWEAEGTVTARAEASIPVLGGTFGGSRELSVTVRRSVSTTYASSEANTVEVSKEASFTLKAPAGKTAALWVSTTQLDVYVCKARKNKIRTNPIDGNCDFSHSVTEEGKKYEVTLTDN